jgi:hypothetical protein
MKSLDAFVQQRFVDAKTLISSMTQSYKEIMNFVRSGDRKAITMTPGPRGMIGEPKLIKDIETSHRTIKNRNMFPLPSSGEPPGVGQGGWLIWARGSASGTRPGLNGRARSQRKDGSWIDPPQPGADQDRAHS